MGLKAKDKLLIYDIRVRLEIGADDAEGIVAAHQLIEAVRALGATAEILNVRAVRRDS